MEGLLRMDPRERLTAREAMFHPYFDGLRSSSEEQQCHEFRSSQQALRRQESATHTGQRLQQQESSRSRSGLRNNVQVIKGGAGVPSSQ
jgi:serine/threonine protein kinase